MEHFGFSYLMPNARIGRCAYLVLNGDESSIFCVSNQACLCRQAGCTAFSDNLST